MAHAFSLAPSFTAYGDAWTAHTASVAANGGMHSTTRAACADVQLQRAKCKQELGHTLDAREARLLSDPI